MNISENATQEEIRQNSIEILRRNIKFLNHQLKQPKVPLVLVENFEETREFMRERLHFYKKQLASESPV